MLLRCYEKKSLVANSTACAEEKEKATQQPKELNQGKAK